MNILTKYDPAAATHWNPFRELDDFSTRLSSLFGRWPQRRDGEREEALTVPEWAPRVDITEDDSEFVIKAELPEVKREDVKVTVENGVLTLTGERKLEKEEKGRKYHRIERAYGSFARTFALPDDANGAKVSALFKDGILRVHLPKSEQAKPKAVEVKVE